MLRGWLVGFNGRGHTCLRGIPSIDPILINLMRHITHRAGTLMARVALGLACACGRPPAPGTPGVAAMEVVAGADQTDTVVAVLERPLVVEVRDGRGRPLPGVVVEFESSLARWKTWPPPWCS